MALTGGISTKATRQRLKVEGIVQGVGFRPFIYSLASSLELAGFVFNNGEGVIIEVEGPPHHLQTFGERLREQPPPLARVEHIAAEPLPTYGDKDFQIVHSRAGEQRSTFVAPDAATCDDCLRELLSEAPTDRRYLYPFINCTNCGPRFTIIQDLPYDRDKTTMRVFPMCSACRREYEDPLDRRFHAQPNACAECGPGVRFERVKGCRGEGVQETLRDSQCPPLKEQAMREATHHLAHGNIVAVKGLGGYHLACDAFDSEAVAALRWVKGRRAKPFALMVPDLETARILCHVGDAEAALLQSRRRPIVLLSRREEVPVAREVAPGYDTLGLMLPYTPLHTLLFHFFAKVKAAGAAKPLALVMTSANVSNEPIIYQNEVARERFARSAYILSHNRDIHSRCDDSVARIVAGGEQLLRRSRGYAPEPIRLAHPFPMPVLACGAHLKNTFCLGKGNQVFLSQHIGDLENMETLLAYRQTIDHFKSLFDVEPGVIAHDLHPEYLATKVANELPGKKIAVQHHHAHIASVLAEHGLEGPVIGVAADGAGYGRDGAIWGGEILIVHLSPGYDDPPGHEYPGCKRAAHLAYVPLPGGEQAVRQPWRMAAAHLHRAFDPGAFHALDIPFVRNLDRSRWSVLEQMIERGLNAPPTSSLGRLFDAVAALLGLRQEVDYEGQAAIELEILAGQCREDQARAYPFALTGSGPETVTLLEPAPMIRAIVADLQTGASPALIAARFHETVAQMLHAICTQVRRQSGLQQVALSGGVFQNRLLLERLLHLLQTDGFETYTNRQVPPNDGGLSLGQAAVGCAWQVRGTAVARNMKRYTE